MSSEVYNLIRFLVHQLILLQRIDHPLESHDPFFMGYSLQIFQSLVSAVVLVRFHYHVCHFVIKLRSVFHVHFLRQRLHLLYFRRYQTAAHETKLLRIPNNRPLRGNIVPFNDFVLNNASLIVAPLTSAWNVTFLLTVPLIAPLHSVLMIASLDILDPLLHTSLSDILNVAPLRSTFLIIDSLTNVLSRFAVGLLVHDRNSLYDAGYVFELLRFRGALMEWMDIGHRAWSASQVASGRHDR